MSLDFSLESIQYDSAYGAYGEVIDSCVVNFETMETACHIAHVTMEAMRDHFIEYLKSPPIRNSVSDDFISRVRLETMCEGRFVYVLRWDGVIISSARVFRRNSEWIKG
jgi:hypothetical protein